AVEMHRRNTALAERAVKLTIVLIAGNDHVVGLNRVIRVAGGDDPSVREYRKTGDVVAVRTYFRDYFSVRAKLQIGLTFRREPHQSKIHAVVAPKTHSAADNDATVRANRQRRNAHIGQRAFGNKSPFLTEMHVGVTVFLVPRHEKTGRVAIRLQYV